MSLNQFKPHLGQQRVLSSDKRFITAIAGIQGGKTIVGAIWLCREIYDAYKAGRRGDWLIAAPTNKILQQSTLPKFREFFPSDWGEWKENKSVFELKWGDRIFVRSTDNPDWLEGMTLLGGWLDEAGQMKKQVWINIQGRLAINKGRCLFTTSFYALNWIYRDLMNVARWVNGLEVKPDGDPDVELVSWISTENPAFPKDEYERAKKSLSPAIFARRYMGQPTRLEGLVYPVTEKNFIKPFDIPENWRRFAGLDFGHSNPTALLCIAENPETHDFVAYKEFYKAGTLLTDVVRFMQENQGIKYVLADPQSAQLIAELRSNYGLGILQPAENDIDLGIERVSGLIREGRIKFFTTLENTIDELETYHYPTPDDEGVTKDKPVAKKNHAMDALRYAFSKRIEASLFHNRFENKKAFVRSRTVTEVNSWTGY